METSLGRPSKYDPSYCDMLIEHMGQGFSFESFSAVIQVNRDTIYEWTKVHPAFSDAKKTALERNLYFWEQQGIKNLMSSKECPFNTALWIFNMKNRHGWRDTRDVNMKSETTIKQEQEREKIRAMPTGDLLALVQREIEEKK